MGANEEEIYKGTVKWFNSEKGYGFITYNGCDVFVHFKKIRTTGYRTLQDEEVVEFTMREGPRGLEATNVYRL